MSAAKKCRQCGGGIYYGEHYHGCPLALRAKHKPSAAGYGVFMHSAGNGYVVRAMDDLLDPYHKMTPERVFKSKAVAQKYADKLNESASAGRHAARNSRGRFTRVR